MPESPAVAAAAPPVASPTFDGLLFDMGDVLYDATLWRRWLWRLLTKMGVTHSYDALFTIWDDQYLDLVHRGIGDYATAFVDFLTSLSVASPLIDEIVAASRIRKRELESEARPLAGVRPTIERLAMLGVPLAIVSDSETPAAGLETYLHRLGLGGRFAAIVSSRDLGCTKPDPRCYVTALEQLGLSPQSTAFVGHDPVELAGARAVGVASIAFNHAPGCQAEIQLRHFRELLAYVRPAKSLSCAS
ncbi:MAG: HAD family hydrolase [Planctomycetia bacterium]|nr:HAD family hydrolase [Planctomycetia bacterium]